MQSHNKTSWYLFKDPQGAPMLYYNGETGEHRCVGDYQNTMVEQVPLTKVPNKSLLKVIIHKRNVKMIKSTGTQTEQHKKEQTQTLHTNDTASSKACSHNHTQATTQTEQNCELQMQTLGPNVRVASSNSVSQELTQFGVLQAIKAITTSNLTPERFHFLKQAEPTITTTRNASFKDHDQHIVGVKDVYAKEKSHLPVSLSNAVTTSQFSLKECPAIQQRDAPAKTVKTTNFISRETPHLSLAHSNSATFSQCTLKGSAPTAANGCDWLQMHVGRQKGSSMGNSPSSPLFEKMDNDICRADFNVQTGDKSNHQSSLNLDKDDVTNKAYSCVNLEKDNGSRQKGSFVINLEKNDTNDNRDSTNLGKNDYLFDDKTEYTNAKDSLTGNLFAIELSSAIADEDLPTRKLHQDDDIAVSLRRSHNATPSNSPKTNAEEVQDDCDNSTSKETKEAFTHQPLMGLTHKTLQQRSLYETKSPGTILDTTDITSSRNTPPGFKDSCQSSKNKNLDAFQTEREIAIHNSTLEDAAPGSKDGRQAFLGKNANASQATSTCENVVLNSVQNATHKTIPSSDIQRDMQNSRRSFRGACEKPSKRKRLPRTNPSDLNQDVYKSISKDSQGKLKNSRQTVKEIKKKKKKRVAVDILQRKGLHQADVPNKGSNSTHDLISNDTQPLLVDSHHSVQNGSPKILKSSTTNEYDSESGMDTQLTSEKRFRFLRNEDRLLLEMIEKEIDKELELNDFEPPLSVEIKEEPNTDGKELEEPENQTCDNGSALSSEDFHLVDLLPKKKKKKVHKCDFCDLSFARSHHLKRHIEYIHPQNMTKIPQRRRLRRHACTICNKAFVEKSCLKKHMRTHSGEKPYRCPYCGKCFAQIPNFYRHKRIHTGQKPYKCNDCGKAFSQSTHLARHVLIHSGEKPYQCSQCSKTYRTRSHLVRHLKSSSHEGIIVKPISSKS